MVPDAIGLALIGLGPTNVTWAPEIASVPLEKYREKRSADTTPEPFGRGGENRPHLFVVQKHAATRLHYDFRLEWGGVLKSWAVPQGPSPDPADKRLAVEVEDHPVEYADFEGVIPEGNYGAGEVIVWDRGRWTPLGDLDEGMKKGKLLFELHGYKLRGVWTLVRMKTKGKTTGKEWLLIKERDGWARKGPEAAYPQESIFSGLTLEELAAGASRAAEIRAELERLGAPTRRVRAADVEADARRAARRGRSRRPAGSGSSSTTATGCSPAREDGKPVLRYRRGDELDRDLPRDRARRRRALPYDSLRPRRRGRRARRRRSKPSFGLLQKRALLQRRPDIERAAVELPATLFVFDLLALRGLRPAPAAADRAQGPPRSASCPRAGPLRFADHVEEQRRGVPRGGRRAGPRGHRRQEGRLAVPRRRARATGSRCGSTARATSRSSATRSPRASRSGFGALHLASWRDGGLVYAGRVGTGFSEKQLARSARGSSSASAPTPPCGGRGADRAAATSGSSRSSSCEVRYKEWTGEGLLRHPVFLRLRDDKPPRGVRASRTSRRRRSTSRRRPPSGTPTPRGEGRPASPTSTRSSGPRRATRRATSSSTTARSRPGCCPTSRTGRS